MKKAALIFILAGAAMSQANAQQREYFSEDSFEAESEIPASRVFQYYYDENLKPHKLTFEDWFNGPYMLRTGFRARTYLESQGIIPNVTYIGNLAGNPVGGMRQGVTNTSSVNLGVGLDLEKLTGMKEFKGWSIGNTWVWRFGNSLTKEYIGNTFNVQQNYGSQTIRLQSLFASWNGDIGTSDFSAMIKIGRFGAGDNFLSKPIYWLYQNNAIDGNPVGIFNQTKWSAYPGGTWAAFARISHKDGAYFKAGVYQINSDEQDSPHEHGLDWSMGGAEGVNANFELGLDINHDESRLSPGNISVGIAADWYSAKRYSNPSKTSPFNCTIYFQADYMILNLGLPPRDSPLYFERTPDNAYRDLRGLILWGAVQYDPYEDLAYMPFFVTGGVLFNAPFSSRPDDVLCFGAAYGKYSDKLNDSERGSYEIMLELNYKIQVTRFLFFQPNVQYIINPKGGAQNDAFVLGLQFGANF